MRAILLPMLGPAQVRTFEADTVQDLFKQFKQLLGDQLEHLTTAELLHDSGMADTWHPVTPCILARKDRGASGEGSLGSRYSLSGPLLLVGLNQRSASTRPNFRYVDPPAALFSSWGLDPGPTGEGVAQW